MTAGNVNNRPEDGWLKEAWGLLINNVSIWAPFIVIYLLISFLPSFFRLPYAIQNIMHSSADVAMPPENWPLVIICSLIDILMRPFFYVVGVLSVQKKEISFSSLWPGWSVYFRFFGYSIIFGAITIASLLLCILPVFFVPTIFLPGFALVASGEPVFDSLRKCFNGVGPHIWRAGWILFIYDLLAIVVSCTCVGILIVLPMSYLLVCLAARDYAGLHVDRSSSDIIQEETIPGVWPPPASFYSSEEHPPKSHDDNDVDGHS